MTTHPTRQAHPEPAGSVVRIDRRQQRSEPTAQSAAPAPAGTPVAEQRPTLTVAEAATLLGVSRWLVQQQVSCGVLPAVRLGRRILIPRARLLAWLETQS